MTSDRPAARLRIILTAAAAIAAVIPLVALAGWSARSPLLREVIPGAIAMNPLTAVLLLVAAGALWRRGRPDGGGTVALLLSGLVVLGGASRFVSPGGDAPLALDLLLFRGQVLALTPVSRMAYSTAICLVALGIALLAYRPGMIARGRRGIIILPAAVFALLAATGYLYSAEWFFHIPALNPMALNTAIAVLALCLGFAALPPALPPVNRLVEEGVGGTAARRLLPAAFLIPFALGYLRVRGERAGVFDLGFGTAAFVVLTALVLALLVLMSVRQVQESARVQAGLAQAVRDSEERTVRLLNGLPTGIFVVDAAGRPSYANGKSGEILGRGTLPDARPEEISERYQVYRAGSNEIYPAEQIPVMRALRGEEVHASDLEIHRPDRVVPLEVWARPIRTSEGEIELAVAAFNDITERLEANRKIEELNRELEHQVNELAAVNKELETFSYSVSHDLRAPLRAVDGFSRVLETDYAASLDPEAVRYLGRIRGNVRRMGLLIDDLLKFSRLSRKDLETLGVDMNSLVHNVVDDLSRNRDAVPPIEVGNLPAAQGDIDLLRQVWTNLVDNAIKYSAKRPDPRIEISAVLDGAEVRYTVRDNGVGFDMAYADKLFGVFQRLHRQDEFEGTGVGLAIVQRVVHRHGGRVWAEARPEQGAAFHFTLPAEKTHGGR